MEPDKDKTKLNRVTDLRLIGFYKIVEPFAAFKAKRDKAVVANIKRILESLAAESSRIE
jgi:hypothetical protein